MPGNRLTLLCCLEGSTSEDGSGAFTNLRISLWLQGSLFVLPSAAILFCGFPSASRADQTDWEGQTGKLAYMTEHTHQAAKA